MSLSLRDYHQLHAALVDAFTYEELSGLVRNQFGFSLYGISTGANVAKVVADLVDWANRSNRINDLIFAALNTHPENRLLRELDPHFKPLSEISPDERSGPVNKLIAEAKKQRAATLDLSNRMLATIPAEVFKISSLETLKLGSNHLEHVPADIALLQSLKTLDLADNLLTQLPQEIAQLRGLRTLNAGRNRFDRCPDAIAGLRLHTLDLQYNLIEQLPEIPPAWSELRRLDLGSNQLHELPAGLDKLQSIMSLDLSHNQLAALPPQLAELSTLRTLNLAGNRLHSLPEGPGRLNLQELDLSENQFTAIPEPVALMTGLTYLNLAGNRLTEAPPWLVNLNQLRTIHLDGNPFAESAQFLLTVKDPRLLFTFIEEIGNRKTRSLREAKVIFVGEPFVGKTSLVHRLRHGTYNPDPEATRELNISTWATTLGGDHIQLNVWDFGGQDIMHATHQFFLTKRSVYVVVIDSRIGDRSSRLDYWLKLVRSFGGNSPILIVGNKSDQFPVDLNWRFLKEKYNIFGDFRRCSCLTGEGIEDVRNAINAAILQLAHINDRLPESWFKVKHELETSDRDFISYEEFGAMAAARGIKDEDSQVTLLKYLHDLGIALWFGDDPRLHDTNVINPSWLTKGVYKIVSSDLLAEQKGKIRLSQVMDLLDRKVYPKPKVVFIIDVMKRFELCFPMDSEPNDECILVPALLPVEEPAVSMKPGALRFEIRYEALPNSIISRLIVRTHIFSPDNTFWRTGILLKDGDATALVRADEADNKIAIVISGPQGASRRFLDYVRRELRAIHHSISNIKAEEWLPIGDTGAAIEYDALLAYEQEGIDSVMVRVGGTFTKFLIKPLLNGLGASEPEAADAPTTMSEPLHRVYQDLVDFVAQLPVAREYAGRTVLLSGISGSLDLNRNAQNIRIDLDLIIQQIWNRAPAITPNHPVWIFVHNAVRYVGGAEEAQGQKLLALLDKLCALY